MSSDSRIEVQTCPWQVAPALLGSGGALFAIGDVHGYADHLKALQDFIARRIRDSYDPSEVTVVWLGDYVDRGPKPRETLDLVRHGLGIEGVREIALRGNHESFLLDMIDDPDPDKETLDLWRLNGGSDTISALLPKCRESCVRRLGQALRESLGGARLDFLHRLASDGSTKKTCSGFASRFSSPFGGLSTLSSFTVTRRRCRGSINTVSGLIAACSFPGS